MKDFMNKYLKWIIISVSVLILATLLGLAVNTRFCLSIPNPSALEANPLTGEMPSYEEPAVMDCIFGILSSGTVPEGAVRNGWNVEEGSFAIYTSPFRADVFFPVFLTVVGIAGAVILLIVTEGQAKKARREGHEHGKRHIATKRDYKAFNQKYGDPNGDTIRFSKNVAMSMDNKKTNRTTNTLVIGGTGTGKTFRYIKPNIANFNASRVITDPSGDIFSSFAPALIKAGKTVYLFNIKDFALSNHYNPLLNVYDGDGNIDNQKVDILVDIYMENASEGNAQGGNDPFWPKSEKAFLTGVIYYVLENDDIPKEDKCFHTVLEKVQLARAEGNARGDSTTLLTKEIREWQSRMEAEGRSIMTPLYYDTFLIAPEKTANTILITTAVDLQIFSNPAVDRITRHNVKYPDLNINLDDIVQTESYLFLSIPQDNKAYNFLIAMIYSQLFSRMYVLGETLLRDKWVVCRALGFPMFNCFDTKEDAEKFQNEIGEDNIIELPYINGTSIYYLVWKNRVWKKTFFKEPMIELVKNVKKYQIFNTNGYWDSPALPMRVELMLDEFKNIGKIPNFDTIIATCRKYRIGTHVVIQDIAQLKEIYPNESHQTILANVDTTLYLGSSLPEDKEYIQKKIGKTTIRQKSTSSQKSGGSTSYTPTEVDLMSMDEIEGINMNGRNDCIVDIRDIVTFVDEKLSFLDHPNFHLLKEARNINIKAYFENNKENQIV